MTTLAEVVTLDTRNAFEVDAGTFADAIDWRIAKFTGFLTPFVPTRRSCRTKPW